MKKIPYENCFASHPKAKFWSTKNEGKPEDYALNSHNKFWFDCDKCGHEFNQDLNHINISNRWCPYCSHQKLCDNEECKFCFENSFASHPKCIYWSNKNILNPRQLFKSKPRDKYKFDCNKCSHYFEISLNKLSSLDRWCPYCSNSKLCENIDCCMCYNNSFASIERSKYLSDKTINPRMLFKSTNKKYNFDCDKCNNHFNMRLSMVTNGNWCSNCLNKTEDKLYNKLSIHYNVQRQYKPSWCKNPNTNKYLPFDFILEELNIIVEQDGPQHFKQIGNWQSPELTKNNDIYKMKCANENGFSIIRLLQKDIWHDRYDWLSELLENINNIVNKQVVQNIYMCKNDEYKDFEISI
jgi:very-short-patch-repair endonuclease